MKLACVCMHMRACLVADIGCVSLLITKAEAGTG